MAKNDYIPRDDAGRVALLTNFRNTVGPFATQLGLSPADLDGQAADAAWARYVLRHSRVMKSSSKAWNNYRELLFLGEGAPTVPVTPALPTPAPDPVEPGIFARFRALVRRIKTAPGYSEATGRALGIIGTEPAPPDQATLSPKLRLRNEGTRVTILWKKGRNEALYIEVDRGQGKWELLTTALHPDTVDPEPFPAIPAKWRYRAYYISKGKAHGQRSSIAEITVGA